MGRLSPREVKRLVLERDRECMAARLGFLHQCRDRWGLPHPSDATSKLSNEHVKKHLMMGVRAPDAPEHCVAVCYAINLQPPTKAMRAAFREYLEGMYG